MSIRPLFSRALGEYSLDADPELCEKIKAVNFEKSSASDTPIWTSSNKHVLNLFPPVAKKISDLFASYYSDSCGDSVTAFTLTTSWATKTPKGSFCQLHRHSNCMYSGVWFFDEYEDNTGKFELQDPYLLHLDFLVLPQKDTEYNRRQYSITPESGLMVFFPSFLFHRIGYNHSEKTRYSLAFNFMPTGTIGTGDSYVDLMKVR